MPGSTLSFDAFASMRALLRQLRGGTSQRAAAAPDAESPAPNAGGDARPAAQLGGDAERRFFEAKTRPDASGEPSR